MDDHQTLSVAFLGTFFIKLAHINLIGPFKEPLKPKIEKPFNIISY
jgi:hypothetical protein